MVRAGVRQTKNKEDYASSKSGSELLTVILDLVDSAAKLLKIEGRLVYVILI